MLSPDLLAQSDPELWNAVRLENQRQEDHVELIASELGSLPRPAEAVDPKAQATAG